MGGRERQFPLCSQVIVLDSLHDLLYAANKPLLHKHTIPKGLVQQPMLRSVMSDHLQTV